MTKVNRKFEYALMAMKYMSQKIPGELTTANEVAEKLSVPFDPVAKVMQILAQNEVLKVTHGVNGGYQILRDLGKVSVFDLLQMIEGPMALVKCIQGEEYCEISGHCNVASPMTVLNQKMNSFYQSLSLKEILINKKDENGKEKDSKEKNSKEMNSREMNSKEESDIEILGGIDYV